MIRLVYMHNIEKPLRCPVHKILLDLEYKCFEKRHNSLTIRYTMFEWLFQDTQKNSGVGFQMHSLATYKGLTTLKIDFIILHW